MTPRQAPAIYMRPLEKSCETADAAGVEDMT